MESSVASHLALDPDVKKRAVARPAVFIVFVYACTISVCARART
jgi:hypothetical protein